MTDTRTNPDPNTQLCLLQMSLKLKVESSLSGHYGLLLSAKLIWCTVIPEEEHVVRVESINDSALLLQGQHADVQLPGVQEVQHHLDHLCLLDADRLVCRHDYRSMVAAYSWLE